MNSIREEGIPLVVTDSAGRFLDLSYTDQKGFNKSLEQKELWHRDRNTGRLIPYKTPGFLRDMKNNGFWYLAVVDSIHNKKSIQKSKGIEENNQAGESKYNSSSGSILERLYYMAEERKRQGKEGSYTTYLFNQGLDKIRKKLGEEAVELILAEKKEDRIYETADLLYHLMVYLCAGGISLQEVFTELEERERA